MVAPFWLQLLPQKLYGKHSKVLRATLKISRNHYHKKQQVYCYLLHIFQTIQVRWARHAHWLQWKYGRSHKGRSKGFLRIVTPVLVDHQKLTFISCLQTLCTVYRTCPERERERERERGRERERERESQRNRARLNDDGFQIMAVHLTPLPPFIINISYKWIKAYSTFFKLNHWFASR